MLDHALERIGRLAPDNAHGVFIGETVAGADDGGREPGPEDLPVIS